MPLPSYLNANAKQAPLQILLKDGKVQLAQLLEVKKCPLNPEDSALHRRDQSSELVLQPCGLVKENLSSPPRVKTRDLPTITCQPCHWICALPTWNMNLVPGDGLSRLGDISLLVEVVDVGADVNLWDLAFPGQANFRPASSLTPPRQNAWSRNQPQAFPIPTFSASNNIAWVPCMVTNVNGTQRVTQMQGPPVTAGSMGSRCQGWRQGAWTPVQYPPQVADQPRDQARSRQAPPNSRGSPTTATSQALTNTTATRGQPHQEHRGPCATPPAAPQPAGRVHDYSHQSLPSRAQSDESTRASDSDGGDSSKLRPNESDEALAPRPGFEPTADAAEVMVEAEEDSLALAVVSEETMLLFPKPGPQCMPRDKDPLPLVPALKPGLVNAGFGMSNEGDIAPNCHQVKSLPVGSTVQQFIVDKDLPTVRQRGQEGSGAVSGRRLSQIPDKVDRRQNLKWDLVLSLNLDAPQWCLERAV